MSQEDVSVDWPFVTLGDLGAWGSGGTPSRKNPEYFVGDIPWIKTGELGNRYVNNAEEKISQEAINKSSAKIFPAGSIAIAMYGATIGKTSILGIDAATNQACAVVSPDEKFVDRDYLYYLLRGEKDAFIAKGKGGAQPNISQEIIKSHEVRLLSLAEQKQIAAKLDELLAQVDTLAARLEAIPKILKRFRQSVLAAAVSGRLTEAWRGEFESQLGAVGEGIASKGAADADGKKQGAASSAPTAARSEFVGAPLAAPLTNWVDTTLANIVQKIEAGKSLKCIETPPQDGEYGIIKISAVTWGRFNENESKTLPDKSQFIEDRRVKIGDFLISRANTIELLGNPVIVHAVSKNLMLSDKVLRLVMSDSDKPWLNIFLRSDQGRKEIESRSTGNQLSMRNIGQKDLLDIPILQPPETEKTQIVHRVEELFAFADQIEQRAKVATRTIAPLRQSILAKAFRGDLTAQWRAENPELISGENSAQALLERIRAGRERNAVRGNKQGRSKRRPYGGTD